MQCRACLRRPGSLPLFGPEAGRRAHMLAAVLALPVRTPRDPFCPPHRGTKVTEDDQLPTHICPSCFSHLKIAYTFRQKCEFSYKLLTNSITAENQDDFVTLNIGDVENIDIDCGDLRLDSFEVFENDIQIELDADKVIETQPPLIQDIVIETQPPPIQDIVIETQPPPIQIEIINEKNNYVEVEVPHPTDTKINKRHKKIRIDTRKHGYFIVPNKDDVGLDPDYLEALYKIYKHRCSHCPRIYAVASYFKVHINSHLGIKPYFCEICKKSFHDERSHIKYHKQRKEKGSYKCQYCDRAYNCKGSLRTHMKIHTGEIKWFPCSHCSRKFNQLNKLKNHMVVHSTDRNFVCQYCSKAFRFDRNLKAHIRSVHVKIRSYMCDICPKGFTTVHELTLHKKRHLGIKNFSCPICYLPFVSSSEVRSHIQSVHVKTKNYACRNCGLRFARTAQRNNHEQSKRCFINIPSSTLDIIDTEIALAIEAGTFPEELMLAKNPHKADEFIDRNFVIDTSFVQ